MKATVVYAASGVQHVLAVDVPDGATVADAIAASGLLALAEFHLQFGSRLRARRRRRSGPGFAAGPGIGCGH